MCQYFLSLSLATSLLWSLCTVVGADEASGIRFSQDIQPILSDHCYECHGPDQEQRKADLRLDTREGLRGVVEPGDVDGSELLRRIMTSDPDEVMPPASTKRALTKDQIQKLTEWTRNGAPWQAHWAFEPIRRPGLPRVSRQGWGQNPIDRFVLQRMGGPGLTPSPPAERQTLIRRVYLDMLGVLPTIAQADAYFNDNAPDAYERLVDSVLASPQYGERWGRHWLDQARYADSDGYSIDGAREMWPYRDWVIRAMNDDLPFDQFTIEQLAGDLMPDPSIDQLVASGFHRNTLVNQEGGSDPEQFRNETVVDRVNTTGAVWLGLTVGCAQCHAHKFDPITHEDYYGLFAFFNSGEDKNSHEPRIVPASEPVRQELQRLRTRLDEARQSLKRLNKEKQESAAQQGTRHVNDLRRQIDKIERKYGRVMIMQDKEQPRDTFVLVRGDFLRPSDKVQPSVPGVLGRLSAGDHATRLDLARWIVDPRNPLTARVTVNRIWMQLFGRGLVETENDFGIRGTPPSHPLLLDWLAAEFIGQKWSVKAIHRLILNSATYRQSSLVRSKDLTIDQANVWLARQSRLRVTAEVVRDLFLSTAGLLSDRIGGPSVFPPQPEGVYAFTQQNKKWDESRGADRFRRGMYTFFFRSAPHPFLTSFDAPNFQTACTQRIRSNTPLQSLTLANDVALIEAARALADAVNLPGLNDRQRVELLFQRCLTRDPSSAEADRLLAFLHQQKQSFHDQPNAAAELLNVTIPIASEDLADRAAWVATCRVVLNLDEFVVRN